MRTYGGVLEIFVSVVFFVRYPNPTPKRKLTVLILLLLNGKLMKGYKATACPMTSVFPKLE